MVLFGELAALLTAFCWSGSSFAFASAVERVGSLQVNINRMILASFFLFITVAVFQFDHNISSSQLSNLVFSGIIGLVIGDTFLFKSYQYIGARLSMLLMSLSPVISAVLAYFYLGEVLSYWGMLGMVITIGGIALVVLERHEIPTSKYKVSGIGIFYGVMGAVGQSVGLIFAKYAFSEGSINGFVASFIRITAAVIIYLPLAIAARRYKNPVKLYSANLKALGATLTGTILGPFLGITLSLIAVANAKVGIAATLMATVPIIMLPMAKYIFKESISWRAITGAVAAVGGIAILFLR